MRLVYGKKKPDPRPALQLFRWFSPGFNWVELIIDRSRICFTNNMNVKVVKGRSRTEDVRMSQLRFQILIQHSNTVWTYFFCVKWAASWITAHYSRQLLYCAWAATNMPNILDPTFWKAIDGFCWLTKESVYIGSNCMIVFCFYFLKTLDYNYNVGQWLHYCTNKSRRKFYVSNGTSNH